MSEFQITYWRDLPSLVTARDGDNVAKSSLAQRFQEAIDEAAMRIGAADADAYMEGWRRSEWESADGTPTEIAERVANDIETTWTDEKLTAFLDELGPASEAQ
jgi:chloramphenicol 3-O-phosphotransferase